MPLQIRTELLAAFERFDDDRRERQNNMIRGRDTLHSQLNWKFGYVDEDGALPIGKRSSINKDYEAEYDAIEAQFRSEYELISLSRAEWMRQRGVTPYEYLFLDDMSSSGLRMLLTSFTSCAILEYEWLRGKADLLISEWSDRYALNELIRRVSMEKEDFDFAATRYRKFAGRSRWHIPTNRVIDQYRRTWFEELDGRLGRKRIKA